MARRISGRYADDETMEGARRIAEAQFDLNRVRNRRRLLITQFLVNPYFVPRHIRRLQLWGLHLALGARFRVLPVEVHKIEVHKLKELFTPMPPESEEKLATILRQKTSELATLDRYERRALSRRKATIRNFDAARMRARRRIYGNDGAAFLRYALFLPAFSFLRWPRRRPPPALGLSPIASPFIVPNLQEASPSYA